MTHAGQRDGADGDAVAGEVGLVTGRVTAATSAGDIRYLSRGDALYEGEIKDACLNAVVHARGPQNG